MDFHKLQQKLFQMDPTDPREDLAKLQAQAANPQQSVAPTVNYVQESVEVTQGSMPLGIDSVSDFAALAGVVTEGKQKTGSAGQAKGKDPMPKAKPGRTKHPLQDKLVGEDNTKMQALEARVAYLENVIQSLLEGKPKMAKPSNPVAKHMNTYNKASVVPDKKKDAKSGKMKHKGKEFESIKEHLYTLLDNKK